MLIEAKERILSSGIHLYEKHGFQRYGIWPRAFKLKDGTYRDEIIMVKML